MVCQVGQTGDDKKYHWVNTDDYDLDIYDLAADLKTLTKAEKKNFYVENHVQVNVDVTAGGEFDEILAHIQKLGKLFTENLGSIFINLIFPGTGDVECRPKGSNVLAVQTVAAILPLAEKISYFEALDRCVVTLHTPAGFEGYLAWEWLDHAVPFTVLPQDFWRLNWLP